jgi:probable HAF family extracellular repeat protein
VKKIFDTLCLGLFFAANSCFAQMYTVTDLGTLGGQWSSASGINASGQVVGDSGLPDFAGHAFRTAPNSPINPATDDVGTFGDTEGKGDHSEGHAINASGQVVGGSFVHYGAIFHAFRTAPNRPINPATDDLGTLGDVFSTATGINESGQVVGDSNTVGAIAPHAFRTAPNHSINPATDDLGTLGGILSQASGINAPGQVVGIASLTGDTTYHAFRTAPNRAIHPETDDLGTLGGSLSYANRINAFGQVVGASSIAGDAAAHAFRTGPNTRINPATDDLGTLSGTSSTGIGIDDNGEVVGWASLTGDTNTHAFVYSTGGMRDLNDLIPGDSGCELFTAVDINDAGKIAVDGNCHGQQRTILLTPVYKSFVRPPINADGSSVFKSKRGVIPVKFSLTQNGVSTCSLPPATIALTRARGLRTVDDSIYSTPADQGSNFDVRPSSCQYVYHVAASRLWTGTYRIDISIDGIMIGHAVFTLK